MPAKTNEVTRLLTVMLRCQYFLKKLSECNNITVSSNGFRQAFTLPALGRWLRAFGIEPRITLNGLKGLRRYRLDYYRLKEQSRIASTKCSIRASYPCLNDLAKQPGNVTGHYFHQDLFVAQRIFSQNPEKHVDIGSRIDGFVAHIASFRKIEVFDYRDLLTPIPNVVFRQCDLLAPPPNLNNYCDSLSCLHVIEHVGLGRYGDPIDLFGHLKALQSLATILKPNGLLYLSAPFGEERIEFNAHRVFSLATLVEMVRSKFRLLGFSYVDDAGNFEPNANLDNLLARNPPANFSLAIFELQKT
jgi:SAM-dependent methyltransferase